MATTEHSFLRDLDSRFVLLASDLLYVEDPNVVPAEGNYKARFDLIETQIILKHLEDADPHPQYLTPDELPSFAVGWLTNDVHPDDPTMLTYVTSEPTDPESTVQATANTLNVPDIAGDWLRDVAFPVDIPFHETESRLTIACEKSNATDAGMYFEFIWLQGGVGGTEVSLGVSAEVAISQPRQTYTIRNAIQGPIDLLTGDQLIVRIYVVKRSNGADPLITIFMEGNNETRIVTYNPIPSFPAPHTHTEDEITDLDRVRWVEPYSVGELYEDNDMVLDGDWTMIANKQTTDRAAPQPTGEQIYAYDGVGGEDNDTVKSLIFGNRYTTGGAGYLVGYRIYTKIGNHYVVYKIDDPLGVREINTVLDFTANTDGWTEFGLSPTLFLGGVVFDLVVIANEPDPTPTVWQGDWLYVTTNNETVPAAGNITHANKLLGELWISKTDANAGDRSAELLALVPGDIIDGANVRWSIQSVLDQGSYVSYTVAPQTQGVGGVDTFDFETVTATPITFFEDVDYWLTSPYNVNGLFIADGDYDDIVPNETAYGTDVKFQFAVASEDWDVVVAPTGSGGGGGGGGGLELHNLNYHSDVDHQAIGLGLTEGQPLAWDNSEGVWTNSKFGFIDNDGIFPNVANGPMLRRTDPANGSRPTIVPNKSLLDTGLSLIDGDQMIWHFADGSGFRMGRTTTSSVPWIGSSNQTSDVDNVANVGQIYIKSGNIWYRKPDGTIVQVTT